MGSVGRSVAGIGVVWGAALALNRSLRRVRGVSMTPTLDPGDVVLTVPRWRRSRRLPDRGAVVLVRDPRDRRHAQVKRVLGLPGESLRVHHGRLLVDGVGQVERYATGRGPDGRLTVPSDHVAVLGDARDASTDSRTYGAVPLTLVDALVVARVAPTPRLLRARPRPLRLTDEAGPDAA